MKNNYVKNARDCTSLSQEERCGEAEASMGQAAKIQEDSEILESALRDIAHAVIQDAECRDMENAQAPPHVHLSPSGARPQRSPKRSSRSNTIPAFAESTISAVQAALHKYQLTIHELQVRYISCNEKKQIYIYINLYINLQYEDIHIRTCTSKDIHFYINVRSGGIKN